MAIDLAMGVRAPYTTLGEVKTRLTYLHQSEGKSWRTIAKEPEFEGLTIGSLQRIQTGVEPGPKVRKQLGLPPTAIVVVIGGGEIPPGAQVISAAFCIECGQPFIGNHPRRKKCFRCSPFMGKRKAKK